MSRTLIRGLVRRRPGFRDGISIPRIEASATGVAVDQRLLRGFVQVTESPSIDALPLVYPQLIAGPLHVAVLSDVRMPVGAMGIVHVSNRIEQKRSVASNATLDVAVHIEGHRVVKLGAEFDLHTTVRVHGEEVWSAVTTILSRGPWGSGEGERADEADVAVAHEERWSVPEDIGRRYRRVSGDVNPIHLHAIPAKLFGFKRAIAHGTWTMARCAATLGEATESAILDVSFRRPVFLPSVVRFRRDAEGSRFEVVSEDGDKRHIVGSLRQG